MKPFTPGELEIMRVLWEHGTLKPAEIQSRFPRPIKNAALRSALLILLENGHVKRKKEGKAFYYSSVTPQKGTLSKMIRRMADIFSGGSKAALIAELIESEDLSKEDIQELQRIASKKMSEELSHRKRGLL